MRAWDQLVIRALGTKEKECTRETKALFIKRVHDWYLTTCTGVSIHPGRVEPALPIELTTYRKEALQARWSCASSLETFARSFLHRAVRRGVPGLP